VPTLKKKPELAAEKKRGLFREGSVVKVRRRRVFSQEYEGTNLEEHEARGILHRLRLGSKQPNPHEKST